MQSESMLGSAAVLLGALAGATALLVGWVLARRAVRRAGQAARDLLAEARQDAESKVKEILVSGQEKLLAAQEDADRRERELDSREVEVDSRKRQVESDAQALERLRRDLERRRASVAQSEQALRTAEETVRQQRDEARRSLERVAGLTAEQARREVIEGVEEEARKQAARLARRIEDQARENAEREATQLIVQATQRVNLREAAETTVSLIELPNDEIKGRIIGREGRNIRAFEMTTGIDLIVDDTPRAILISSFDPVRREVARVAIDRLVEDGRIHPARIEEVVARVRTEIDALIEETGAKAAFGLGLPELHPKLSRLVGQMRFRTHRGQNLLQHCVEVALIAAHMASEVGARAEVLLRAGLLHEVGRVDDAPKGNSILASADIVAKYGEPEPVVETIQSLHPEAQAKTVEALLLRTANRISDLRPGARKENLDIFIERLRRLESIAGSFPGVSSAYAVKAGKEVRVIVDAKNVRDEDAFALSRQIARALERDLSYTGQIKVSVIRETRAVQFAV